MQVIPFSLIKKTVKPLYNQFLKPFLIDLTTEKKNIKLVGNETEPCLLLREVEGEIIVYAPVFNKDMTISRYLPLTEGREAENLSKLIENALK